MKKYLLAGIMFLVGIGLYNYALVYSPLLVIAQAAEEHEKAVKVEGMNAQSARKVEEEVKKVSGVVSVKADVKAGTVTVKMKAGTDENLIYEAIKKAGVTPK